MRYIVAVLSGTFGEMQINRDVGMERKGEEKATDLDFDLGDEKERGQTLPLTSYLLINYFHLTAIFWVGCLIAQHSPSRSPSRSLYKLVNLRKHGGKDPFEGCQHRISLTGPQPVQA